MASESKPEAGPDLAVVHELTSAAPSLVQEMREAFAYRELLWMLALRDITVRYKQTTLGIAWVVVQPLMFVLVGLMLFRFVGKSSASQGSAIPLLLSGTLLWQLFANIVTRTSESMFANASILTKVYFPRVLVPLAGAASALVDFGVGCGVLLGVMAAMGSHPSFRALWAVFSVAGLVTAAAGLGLMLAALTIRYRDFRYLVPFGLQLGLFLSPVFYPVSAVPEQWRALYALNPNAGYIASFQWALLGEPGCEPFMLVISVIVTGILAISGLSIYTRTQRDFADVA